MQYGKIPPQAVDLEKAVLGAIMLERTAFDKVSAILKPESFYVPAHVSIWTAFLNLLANSMHIDILTVVEALRAAGELESVGGPYYITTLTNAVVSSAHIETHAYIIQKKFMRRQLIRLSSGVLSRAFDDTTDVIQLYDETESELIKIFNDIGQTNYHNAGALALDSMAQVAALQNRSVDLTGIPTGFNSIDRLTCGWQPTDLIIIAARPGIGKTAFALILAVHAVLSKIKPTGIGFFSLEMNALQLTTRIISYMSQVKLDRVSRGRMDADEHTAYDQAVNVFSSLNIQIDDSGALNIQQLRSKARQMVAKDKVGLIIVDYLQLMSGDREKNSNRQEEVSTISRSLKALAKELKVPIIALSQLNRAVETRKGPAAEPMLSDLRESGALEQDSDIVIFLMREDSGMNQEDADPSLAKKAWVKFAKHRNGTLEKLAFETDLSTQSWKEFNAWAQVNKITAGQTNNDDMPF